eukprot:Hpha_TRINITY_DN15939_c1_g14::TRINITY_DN15939_c1_g14_i1::g.71735::m.71735
MSRTRRKARVGGGAEPPPAPPPGGRCSWQQRKVQEYSQRIEQLMEMANRCADGNVVELRQCLAEVDELDTRARAEEQRCRERIARHQPPLTGGAPAGMQLQPAPELHVDAPHRNGGAVRENGGVSRDQKADRLRARRAIRAAERLTQPQTGNTPSTEAVADVGIPRPVLHPGGRPPAQGYTAPRPARPPRRGPEVNPLQQRKAPEPAPAPVRPVVRQTEPAPKKRTAEGRPRPAAQAAAVSQVPAAEGAEVRLPQPLQHQQYHYNPAPPMLQLQPQQPQVVSFDSIMRLLHTHAAGNPPPQQEQRVAVPPPRQVASPKQLFPPQAREEQRASPLERSQSLGAPEASAVCPDSPGSAAFVPPGEAGSMNSSQVSVGALVRERDHLIAHVERARRENQRLAAAERSARQQLRAEVAGLRAERQREESARLRREQRLRDFQLSADERAFPAGSSDAQSSRDEPAGPGLVLREQQRPQEGVEVALRETVAQGLARFGREVLEERVGVAEQLRRLEERQGRQEEAARRESEARAERERVSRLMFVTSETEQRSRALIVDAEGDARTAVEERELRAAERVTRRQPAVEYREATHQRAPDTDRRSELDTSGASLAAQAEASRLETELALVKGREAQTQAQLRDALREASTRAASEQELVIDHQRALAAERRRLQDASERQLESELDAQAERLRLRQQRELAEIKAAALRDAETEQQAELEKVRADARRRTEGLRAEQQEELERARQSARSESQRLRQEQREELTEARAEARRESDRLLAQRQSDLEAAKAAARAGSEEKEALVRKLAQEKAEAESVFRDARRRHEEEVADLQKRLSALADGAESGDSRERERLAQEKDAAEKAFKTAQARHAELQELQSENEREHQRLVREKAAAESALKEEQRRHAEEVGGLQGQLKSLADDVARADPKLAAAQEALQEAQRKHAAEVAELQERLKVESENLREHERKEVRLQQTEGKHATELAELQKRLATAEDAESANAREQERLCQEKAAVEAALREEKERHAAELAALKERDERDRQTAELAALQERDAELSQLRARLQEHAQAQEEAAAVREEAAEEMTECRRLRESLREAEQKHSIVQEQRQREEEQRKKEEEQRQQEEKRALMARQEEIAREHAACARRQIETTEQDGRTTMRIAEADERLPGGSIRGQWEGLERARAAERAVAISAREERGTLEQGEEEARCTVHISEAMGREALRPVPSVLRRLPPHDSGELGSPPVSPRMSPTCSRSASIKSIMSEVEEDAEREREATFKEEERRRSIMGLSSAQGKARAGNAQARRESTEAEVCGIIAEDEAAPRAAIVGEEGTGREALARDELAKKPPPPPPAVEDTGSGYSTPRSSSGSRKSTPRSSRTPSSRHTTPRSSRTVTPHSSPRSSDPRSPRSYDEQDAQDDADREVERDLELGDACVDAMLDTMLEQVIGETIRAQQGKMRRAGMETGVEEETLSLEERIGSKPESEGLRLTEELLPLMSKESNDRGEEEQDEANAREVLRGRRRRELRELISASEASNRGLIAVTQVESWSEITEENLEFVRCHATTREVLSDLLDESLEDAVRIEAERSGGGTIEDDSEDSEVDEMTSSVVSSSASATSSKKKKKKKDKDGKEGKKKDKGEKKKKKEKSEAAGAAAAPPAADDDSSSVSRRGRGKGGRARSPPRRALDNSLSCTQELIDAFAEAAKTGCISNDTLAKVEEERLQVLRERQSLSGVSREEEEGFTVAQRSYHRLIFDACAELQRRHQRREERKRTPLDACEMQSRRLHNSEVRHKREQEGCSEMIVRRMSKWARVGVGADGVRRRTELLPLEQYNDWCDNWVSRREEHELARAVENALLEDLLTDTAEWFASDG